ncbi:6197_t:CDS:1, partial [Rhizophagus irregularis]
KYVHYKTPNEWIISWDSVNNKELYGNSNDPFALSITYREHFIPTTSRDELATLTPRKLTSIY